MKMHFKRLAATTAAVLIAALFSWTFVLARKHHSRKVHPPKVVPIQAAISVQHGQKVITMTPQAQKLAGIVAEPLHKTSAQQQITAPAEVLSVEGLARLRSGYGVAQARLAKARAKAGVSRQEYARLKSLYQNGQNVSQKALQAAKGASQSDHADVQAAREKVALESSMARQNWGSVVEQWVEEGNPLLERVLNQQALLVEVTVPAGKPSGHPSRIQLEMPGAHFKEGQFVSLFPKVDPRMQGTGLLYRTSAHAGLAPGTNLIAHLPVGGRSSGVMVPRSAVVWTEGKSWVYQQAAPGRFVRRPVQLSQPHGKGFFVRQGLSPGDKIVVRGAQVLLSEEFRSEIQPEH